MFEQGMIIQNRYEIIEEVGSGGMSVVYKAKCHVLNRFVAIKVLKPEFSDDKSFVSKFRIEAQSAAGLSHPNIVNVFDVGEENGYYYIVMELVEGITLKEYIQQNGRLPYQTALDFIMQICAGIEVAHEHHTIHRDIKPQNIILQKNGEIKVTDFGIAKMPNADTITMTDKAIGTVYYISPEQASGKQIDPRSDIYSLGVVMYEMATGKLPFVADSPVSVALMQVNERPKPPRELLPEIPAGVESMIMTAMDKDPAKRFQSASAMLHYVLKLREDPGYNFRAHHTGQVTTQIPRTKNQKNVKRGKGKTPQKRTPKQSRSMFPIIAGVVSAFIIVLIIAGVNVIMNVVRNSNENKPITVDIPQFVGKIYNDEMKASIEEEGYFAIELVEEYNEEYEPGYIISQDPAAGSARKVKKGEQLASVKLTVSHGLETLTLGDYSIVEYRTAKLELGKLGLKVEEFGVYDDTVLQYYTIRTEPEAGTELSRGDTVKLFYSLGPEVEYVTIPSFIGYSADEAIAALNELGLTYGKITYDYTDLYVKGEIFSQSKAVGSKAAVGSEIDFVVCIGSESERNKQ